MKQDVKQWYSNIWQLAAQAIDPWEKWISEVYNCPRLLPGEFPGCSVEKGNPNKTRGLSELRRQSFEFEKAKATRISGTEYHRGGHCPEKTPRRLKRGHLWVASWALMYICVRGNYPRPGKEEGG